MDEKKVRKAIKLVEHCIEIQEQCKRVTHANVDAINEDIAAYKVAIEALEKQLPKKVEMLTEYRDLNGNLMCFKAFCPSCGRVVESYRNKNCHVCTQVLDWSE